MPLTAAVAPKTAYHIPFALQGSPFSIVGCSDSLALYKFESSKHCPTTDGRLATCPISRVFADMQPELPELPAATGCSSASQAQQQKQQQMHFDRVAEAQRAGIHSTLVLAIYDLQGSSSSNSGNGSGSGSDTDCYPVAVFELAQHEPDVDFRPAVGLLSRACQVRGMQQIRRTCRCTCVKGTAHYV